MRWLEHKLAAQVNLLQQKPTLKVLHGDEIWIRKGRRVNPAAKHRKYGGFIFQQCLPLCCISPSAVMIHRSVFEQVGTFNENFPVCEDYDLWLRISACFEIGMVQEPLIIKYGGHTDQLSQVYVAMDYWRVLALNNILQSGGLNEGDAQACKAELMRKADILIKGYRKHGHLGKASEIEHMIETI